MNRHILAASLACTLAVLPGCTKDQVDNGIRFTLTIINNNATAYDLFMSSDQDNFGFLPYGTVPASAQKTIGNLIPTSIYTARLTIVGGNPNTFVYEHQVVSGGANVTWAVP